MQSPVDKLCGPGARQRRPRAVASWLFIAQLLLAGVVGALSGVLAKVLGYQALFLSAGVLGLLALAVVGYYFARQPAPHGVAHP